MSRKRIALIAALAIAGFVVLAAGVRIAGVMAAENAISMAPFGGPHATRYLARYLSLTDAQQQSIQQLMQSERPKMQPLLQQLKSAHQQLEAAGEANQLDQAKALAIIDANKDALAQLLVEHARVQSQIMGMLTPEQQTKFKELRSRRGMRMHDWMQHHQMENGNAPATPGASPNEK